MLTCRHNRWLFAGLMAGLSLVAACDDGAATTGDDVVLPASEACDAAVFPPRQEGTHLIGDAQPPVPYSSTPGTSGWHASGVPRTGVLTGADALSETEIVLALEVGQVVAAYDPQRLSGAHTSLLVAIAQRPEVDGRLTVTPFTDPGMDAPLTLNAWGVQQSCTAASEADVLRFIATYGAGAPGHQG